MGRHSGLSPQKDVRRSTRDRSATYGCLDEDRLFSNVLKMSGKSINSVVSEAQRLRDKEAAEAGQPLGYFRPRRHAQPQFTLPDSTDEEEDVPPKKKLRKRSDDGLVYRERGNTATERRRVVLDDDEEENSARSNAVEVEVEEEAMHSSSGYKRSARARSTRNSGGLGSGIGNETGDELQTPVRQMRRTAKNEEDIVQETEEKHLRSRTKPKQEEEEEEEEKMEEGTGGEGAENGNEEPEEEEDEPSEPRQYELRRNRAPVDRLNISFNQSGVKEREREARSETLRRLQALERQNRMERRYESKMHRRNKSRRRIVRSDSDSTDNEEDRRHGGMRRGRANDEEMFEQRKERSMAKHRARFMPINLAEKDLTSGQGIVRDRLRQTGGASCSDIDPMSIDLNVGFDQIGGLDGHIQSLKEVVVFPMLYPNVFKQFDINPPKGVIFYGPPGTGKTLVARALANECRKGANKVAFFMRKGADCLSKWVGESERQLRLLFDQAYSMRPSIIFFDEIDGLAPVRSSRQDQIHASIVSTLLALMDGLDSRGEVIVIGATNRLDTLDPALRRPGRFDRELRFALPDRAARLQILDIHTGTWNENKPDRETLEWIADNSSGYCGADLKYLCTEAVLIALRMQYPHIYMTNDRLAVDIQKIKVKKEHFLDAMRKIVPASRRDMSIPCRPLNDRTSILIGSTIDCILSANIPSGYKNYQTLQNNEQISPLEKVVRALEPPPTVPATRLLLVGSAATPDAGQTAYILPALLSRLDHLPVFSIGISKIFSDGHPEEALSVTMQSAVRAASSGPCIVLLPSADEWFSVVSPSVAHVLQTALDSLSGSTPIMLLATVNSNYEQASDNAKRLFRFAETVSMPAISPSSSKQYFEFVFAPIQLPPKVFDPSQYEIPLKAAEAKPDEVTRKLSAEEARQLEKHYESQQRQFRIFLRDKLNRIIRDRRFTIFVMPVDAEDAEDYYEVITSPLCLTEMMEKIDKKEYVHPDEFLSDIKLIVTNALEYNPNVSVEDKQIRHAAMGLREVSEEIFDSELDEDFVGAMETTAKLLREAGIRPVNERLIDLPEGFVRTEKWSVNDYAMRKNGSMILKAKMDKERATENRTPVGNEAEERQVSKAVSTSAPPASTSISANSLSLNRKRKHRPGSYNFPSSSSKKKKAKQIVKKIAESLENSSADNKNGDVSDQEDMREKENGMEERENEPEIAEGMEEVDEDTQQSMDVVIRGNQEQGLVLDLPRVDALINKCAAMSKDWSIDEFERLAARITQQIEAYKDEWNRLELITKLGDLVLNWTSN